MRRAICVLLGLCLTTDAYAQDTTKVTDGQKSGEEESADLTDPIAILKRVDAASKKVKVVQYKGAVRFTGWLAAGQPTIEGTATIGSAGSLYGFGKCLFDVQVTLPGGTERKHFTVGSNEKTTFLIDHQKKIVYENASHKVIGRTGAAVMMIGMREFVHPKPFSDEINADIAELKGSKKIGDEDCYVIRVVYAGGRQESVWYFSKKDFLPRRREHIDANFWTGERGARQITITDLVIDPKFVRDPFELLVPEGFKKTGEFAP